VKELGKEASIIQELVARYKTSPGNSLLDVGCGTGRHLQHLTGKFDCVGMDVSKKMLEQARRNVKDVELVQGDMVDFDLGREFDVVLCLFSSIGYVRTYPRLGRTLKNLARHLRPGGVTVIEPWFTKSTARAGYIHVLAQGTDDLKIVRVDYTGIKGHMTVVEETIVSAERNKGDHHLQGQNVHGPL
jgi:ubiquinone/menaquinone biosynthesis C-methylase UbiE